MRDLAEHPGQAGVPSSPVGRAFAGTLPNDRVLEMAAGLVPELYSAARWLVEGREAAIGLVDHVITDLARETPPGSPASAADVRLALLSRLVTGASALETGGVEQDLATAFPGRRLGSSDLDQLEALTEPQLRIALGCVPLPVRTPVVLYYLSAFTFREIAEVLGVPVSELARRLGAGRDLLVAELASRHATGRAEIG